MTPSHPLDPTTAGDGLTDADITRITAALDAAIAPSTRAVYLSAWRRWNRWCTEHGHNPLPATPAAVCAYLTQRVEQGLSTASIDLTCSSLSFHHRQAGYTDPITHAAVRQVRAGIRRTLGTAPRRPARPRRRRPAPDPGRH
ncbi:site-specific integrase [Nocardioides daejeonensis]|uniref:site-specific integrase n=1 Tax=Nocardioides daejeonensis TaxID=1046556 RepID=UPI0013A58478|nr:site-specific integrase [Nocardioides daejeonensis]